MEVRKTGGIGYIVGRWPLDSDKFTLVFIHGAGHIVSLERPDEVNTLILEFLDTLGS